MLRIVRLEFEPQHVPSFLRFFEVFKDEIVKFKGLRSLKIMKDIDRDDVFYTLSEWDSVDDLNAYRQSHLFNSVWPEVKKWMSGKTRAYSLEDLA